MIIAIATIRSPNATAVDMEVCEKNEENENELLIENILVYLENHYADDITPVVYKFRDVDKCLNGKYDIQQSYLKGKSIRYKPVDGYLNDLKNDKFLERIRKVIRDIFDRDVPFVQTEHKNRCLYCQFNKICSRSED